MCRCCLAKMGKSLTTLAQKYGLAELRIVSYGAVICMPHEALVLVPTFWSPMTSENADINDSL